LAFLLLTFSAVHAKNESKDSTPSDVKIVTTEKDVKLIRRASEILSNPSVWSRKDNRECPDSAKTFSLYCALYKASIELNGEFDHRLGAIEEVRRTVEEFSKNKKYEHRLMEYNNDTTTSFEDIKNVLKTTQARLAARLHK
jgi:hypothetical protein